MMGGPWFAEGHLIGVDRWSPTFDPESVEGLSSPIWVRFPGLPLHLWGDRNLGRFASRIGTPLWVDEVTDAYGRTEFARVCVRICFSSSLPTGVWVRACGKRFFQPVAYEGIEHLCFRCGMVGHRREECGVAAHPAGVPADTAGGPGPTGPPPVGSMATAGRPEMGAVEAAAVGVADGVASSGATEDLSAVSVGGLPPPLPGVGPRCGVSLSAADDSGWQVVGHRRRVRPPAPSPPVRRSFPRGRQGMGPPLRPGPLVVQGGRAGGSPSRAHSVAGSGASPSLDKGKAILRRPIAPRTAASKRPSSQQWTVSFMAGGGGAI